MAWVAVLMGSESDWPTMQACTEVLSGLDVGFEVRVTSAHRTPEGTAAYIADAVSRDCSAFICAAGMAAHLAGAVAAHTVRPVIGVPIDSGPLAGADALLSTVQMPAGIPVATVAVGKAGRAERGLSRRADHRRGRCQPGGGVGRGPASRAGSGTGPERLRATRPGSVTANRTNSPRNQTFPALAKGASPLSVARAADILAEGGVVAHALEGVWGLACDPFDAGAVARVLDLKGRPVAKGLIVIGASPEVFAAEIEGPLAGDAGSRPRELARRGDLGGAEPRVPGVDHGRGRHRRDPRARPCAGARAGDALRRSAGINVRQSCWMAPGTG